MQKESEITTNRSNSSPFCMPEIPPISFTVHVDICPTCHGSGHAESGKGSKIPCFRCNGTGYLFDDVWV